MVPVQEHSINEVTVLSARREGKQKERQSVRSLTCSVLVAANLLYLCLLGQRVQKLLLTLMA